MGSPLIQYSKIVSLANGGGYNQSPALDQLSAVFLLSSCVVMRSRWLWQSPIDPIGETEYNQIIEMITQAESELMVSVDVGVIVPSVSDLSISGKYLACDGSVVSQSDYPELASAVPSSWLVSGDIELPDMREKGVFGANNGLSVGDSVGENQNILSVEQLPSHRHQVEPHSHGYIQSSASVSAGGEIPATASIVTSSPAVTNNSSPMTDYTGDGESISNVQESLNVFWWIVAR